jgi:hypothetical protein
MLASALTSLDAFRRRPDCPTLTPPRRKDRPGNPAARRHPTASGRQPFAPSPKSAANHQPEPDQAGPSPARLTLEADDTTFGEFGDAVYADADFVQYGLGVLSDGIPGVCLHRGRAKFVEGDQVDPLLRPDASWDIGATNDETGRKPIGQGVQPVPSSDRE